MIGFAAPNRGWVGVRLMAGKFEKVSRSQISVGPDLATAITKHLADCSTDLFHIPVVRRMITAARLKSVKPEAIEEFGKRDRSVIDNAVSYNKQQLLELAALERPRLLIDVLTSIHYIFEHIGELKVLCVGPRTESEIFMLMAAGFKPDNIRGLDLISYSDFIDVGDMHDMPYDDDTFDVVILGWVIGYSKDCKKVADEVVRVAKPGGYVAVGVERPAKRNKPKGGILDGATYFKTTKELEALFAGNVETVLFRHDVHRNMRDKVCHLMLVMELH